MKQQALRTVGIVGVFIGLTVGIVQDTRRLHPSVPSLEAPSEQALVSPAQATSLLAQLPLTFVENQGQWETSAKFLAKKGNLAAWFEPDAITLQLAKRSGEEAVEGVVVRLAFEGASKSAAIEGEQEQRGRYNYFLGNDPTKWQTHVPGYAAVRYHALYDGIDVRVREHEGRLEYDLLLEPEADLSQVVIRTEGIERLELAEDGSLLLHTALGPIEQHPPTTWYELPDGTTQPVEAKFVLLDASRYTFEVPHRNPQLALVIDPGLVYSTYLGGGRYGPQPSDVAYAVQAYPSGVVVLTGDAASWDFPTTPGVFAQRFQGGRADVFVAAIKPDGLGSADLLFSTFLGGRNDDYSYALSLDLSSRPGSSIVVAGQTESDNFPTTPSAYQRGRAGKFDAFLSRLSADGTRLLASTLIGGSEDDRAIALAPAQDGSGDLIIGGATAWTNPSQQPFPTTPSAFQPRHAGGTPLDAFVSRFSGDLTTLGASTFLGGSSEEEALALATRPMSTQLVVVGWTYSTNFPVAPNYPPPGGRALQTSLNGAGDGFVTFMSNDLNGVAYSTYLGGTGVLSYYEQATGVALDAAGAAVVTGFTPSTDFPTTFGAYQTTLAGAGSTDVFLSRVSPQGNGPGDLVYSTYFGGGHFDGMFAGPRGKRPPAVALDASAGFVIIAGETFSSDLPTTPGALQTVFPSGRSDVASGFVAKLQLAATGPADLLYSTYLGGNDGASAKDVAHHPTGVVTVAGVAYQGFPTTPGAYQTAPAGPDNGDAFASWLTLMPTGYDFEGSDTSPCAGPLILRGEGTMPRGGATLLLAVTNGPANAVGAIVFATTRAQQGPWNINPGTIFLVFPISTNERGFGSLSITVPSGIPQGTAFHAQSGVVCPDGRLSFSNGLGITIQ